MKIAKWLLKRSTLLWKVKTSVAKQPESNVNEGLDLLISKADEVTELLALHLGKRVVMKKIDADSFKAFMGILSEVTVRASRIGIAARFKIDGEVNNVSFTVNSFFSINEISQVDT